MVKHALISNSPDFQIIQIVVIVQKKKIIAAITDIYKPITIKTYIYKLRGLVVGVWTCWHADCCCADRCREDVVVWTFAVQIVGMGAIRVTTR